MARDAVSSRLRSDSSRADRARVFAMCRWLLRSRNPIPKKDAPKDMVASVEKKAFGLPMCLALFAAARPTKGNSTIPYVCGEIPTQEDR